MESETAPIAAATLKYIEGHPLKVQKWIRSDRALCGCGAISRTDPESQDTYELAGDADAVPKPGVSSGESSSGSAMRHAHA